MFDVENPSETCFLEAQICFWMVDLKKIACGAFGVGLSKKITHQKKYKSQLCLKRSKMRFFARRRRNFFEVKNWFSVPPPPCFSRI